LGFIYGW